LATTRSPDALAARVAAGLVTYREVVGADAAKGLTRIALGRTKPKLAMVRQCRRRLIWIK
jgi:hypothetical protein